MAVFDPLKKAQAMVSTNMLGSVGGAVAGFLLVRKYMPNRGWVASGLGILGGALGGAYVQSMITSKRGEKKSAEQAKK